MKAISLLFILVACASKEPKYDPIASPLLAKRDEFRSCFLESESYMGKETVESRLLKVALTINKEGKVAKASISETAFKDANFHACILEQVRMIKFDAPKDGKDIEVVQAINFYPNYN